MQMFYLYATIAALSPVVVQAVQRRFKLDVRNNTCATFTNQINHYECNFLKGESGEFLFNARFISDIKLGKDIDMHVRIHVKPWNGKKGYNFLDVTASLCTITSAASSNIFLREIFNEVTRASNFPLDCSFKPNFMYKVENMSISDKIIPVYAPYMDATFSLEFLQKGKIWCNYFVNAALMPKGKD